MLILLFLCLYILINIKLAPMTNPTIEPAKNINARNEKNNIFSISILLPTRSMDTTNSKYT